MSKIKINILSLIISLIFIVFFMKFIPYYLSTLSNNSNNNEEGYQGITQQENYTTSWNETTIKTNEEETFDKIKEDSTNNINQDFNQTSKTDDNILWKEEFEKLKKETKYFPEEMDYDTYVANIQYWNEKTNQAQLKILEERKHQTK